MGVWLDDEFPENAKVEALGDDLAAWLYVAGLCYANRNLTGGRIPKAAALRLTNKASPKLVAKLLGTPLPGHGPLWEDHGDHYRIHNYGSKQQSAEKRRAEKEDAKQRRTEHARKAAAARWAAENGHSDGHGSGMNRASPEHPLGIDRAHPGADNEHGGEHGFSLACPPPQASAAARVTPASALVPRPLAVDPSPNHQVAGNAPATEEKDEDQDHRQDTPPAWDDPLVARLASLWPGRVRMRAESAYCVGLCRQVADEGLIDEAIGAMLGADDKPHTPRYLLATVRNRLVEGGAYVASDERLSVLAPPRRPA